MGLNVTILPAAVTKDLSISPRFTPYEFLSRSKFSTLTIRQPIIMVEFDLPTPTIWIWFTHARKNTNYGFHKNRTHDFRTTSRSPAGYLLDHSGVGDCDV